MPAHRDHESRTDSPALTPSPVPRLRDTLSPKRGEGCGPITLVLRVVSDSLDTEMPDFNPALNALGALDVARRSTAIEEEVNEDYSRPTWEKTQELAKGLNDRRWQARAQAELGIIAFLDGDVATATQALKAALISLYLEGDMAAAIYYGSIVGNGKVEAGGRKDRGQPDSALANKTLFHEYAHSLLH